MAIKPEGKSREGQETEFTQGVASGQKEPRTTNVDDEVRARGFDTSKHVSGPNDNQGGN